MKKPTYAWSCYACGAKNEPHVAICHACSCPAYARTHDIERHRPALGEEKQSFDVTAAIHRHEELVFCLAGAAFGLPLHWAIEYGSLPSWVAAAHYLPILVGFAVGGPLLWRKLKGVKPAGWPFRLGMFSFGWVLFVKLAIAL